MPSSYTVKFTCLDKPGIVSRVTAALVRIGANILDAQQFNDTLNNQFFCRIEFEVPSGVNGTQVSENLEESLTPLASRWSMTSQSDRMRVLLMSSKSDHCLVDLLYRWRNGDLPMDVVGVVSNHPKDAYPHIDFSDIPFHYLPVTAQTKGEQELVFGRDCFFALEARHFCRADQNLSLSLCVLRQRVPGSGALSLIVP